MGLQKNREWLSKKYIDEGKSIIEIGRLLKQNPTTIWRQLLKYGISIKKQSKEFKGKHFSPYTEFKKGQHPSLETEFKIGNHHKSEFKKGKTSLRKGVVLSDITKQKIGISKKGQSPPNKGIPCPEETKNKISKTLKGRYTREKSPSWKGGLTPIDRQIRNSTDYSLWRKICFERDNFICQKCKESGGRLSVHHINNFADFPELRFAIDNGVTLCIKCHKEYHKIYGKRNNTKEQLKEYLKKEGLTKWKKKLMEGNL